MQNISLGGTFHTVTERFKEFDIFLLISGRRLLAHENGHSHLVDEAEEFLLLRLLLGLLLAGLFFLFDQCAVVDLLAEETIISAFHDLYKTLSAGVDNACLLEYGQKLRCVGEYLFRLFKDRAKERFQVLFSCVRELSGLEGRTLGNCQDRAFLGFHNRLISGLNRSVKGVREYRDCESCLCLGNFAKSADQLGKDNAGISSRSAKGAGGHGLADILHAVGIAQCGYLLDS